MNTNDGDIFHDTNVNSFVRKYLWDDEEIPVAVSKDIIKEVETRFEKDQWGLWKIMSSSTGNYLGYTGLWHFFDEELPQLIYVLLPEYAGNGYATEASKEIINYAFEHLKFDHLIASMDKPNEASISVCKRLNMKLVEDKEIDGKPTLFYKIESNTG